MITEHHKEKRHAPRLLLLLALAVALFSIPALPRKTSSFKISPETSNRLVTPIIPFAPEQPSEPVRGTPYHDPNEDH